MNIGIDIKFFEGESPNEIKDGKLYIDMDGNDYLDFQGSWKDAFRMIKTVFAKAVDSGEKYTLINCTFRQSISNSCRFVINEFYKGDFLHNVTEKDCLEVEARATGLTNWINHPRIKPEIIFSNTERSKVIVKEYFTKVFPVSDTIVLEVSEFCGEIYSRNETILQNLSSLRFVSQDATSRLELHKNMQAFISLLSLFTDRLPEVTKLCFTFSNGRVVESLSHTGVKRTDENEALLTFDDLGEFWPIMIKKFFASRDKFNMVLDLLIASIRNNTAEISFLNITTAFEVFHKYFLEKDNDHMLQELFNELKAEGLVKSYHGKWDQIIRYHHLFELTKGIDFFSQNFQYPKKTIALIRDSRNYYTHYTKPRNEIWTPNNLIFANKGLRQLLKAVILKELELPETLINKLLNNRAAVFYQDFEKNEYSVLYLNNQTNISRHPKEGQSVQE